MGRRRTGHKKPGGWRRLLGCLAVLLVCCIAAGAVAGAVVYRHLCKGLPAVTGLEHYRAAETTRILASDGAVIGTLFRQHRIWKPLDRISPYVVKALLATEDSRFYEDHGVDPIGVLRACYTDLTTGRLEEGASTITMQLARNLFLSDAPTFSRKLREIILATRIESHYSKDKILELYLNQVYFGAGAYGIEAAAETYFNEGADRLDPAQAALIVGLVQAPSEYCPLNNPRACRRRQGEVLHRMLVQGYLDSKQYHSALAEAARMHFNHAAERSFELLKYPYFTTYVIHKLSERYSADRLYRSGLTVTTTLDPALQARAQKVLKQDVARLHRSLHVGTGALVALENKTGYVRAMVGGTGWSRKNQFNRAWQARRQPGSCFKTVVYAAAMEQGYTPESLVDDTPVSYDDGTGKPWRPVNDDGRFLGRITFRKALALSRNVAAVKVLSRVGVQPVIKLAYAMGFRARIPENLSIALGAVQVSPLEMAEVLSVFPNLGVDRPPTVIETVKSFNGKLLQDNRHRSHRRVLSRKAAVEMISMLEDVVAWGTATRARVPGHPIAGKTGTTDRFRDAWFCGFSPQYTMAVWVGNDDNSPMRYSYGGYLPATIFRQVMSFALKGLPSGSFPAYKPAPSPQKNAVDTQPAAVVPTPVAPLATGQPSRATPSPTPIGVDRAPAPEPVTLPPPQKAPPPVKSKPLSSPSPGWFDNNG